MSIFYLFETEYRISKICMMCFECTEGIEKVPSVDCINITQENDFLSLYKVVWIQQKLQWNNKTLQMFK